MIYVTGDTHSSFDRFTRKRFPAQRELTKEDVMIIAGDFGGIWVGREEEKDLRTERAILEELDHRSFTTVFVSGNHENYGRLMSEEFPIALWKKGRVKVICPSLFMLMRGEIYEIEGKRIFAFGGAKSHDISDGILDPAQGDLKKRERELKRRGRKSYRILGKSWWREELPLEEEMGHGIRRLEEYHWEVDFVITHCAPTFLQRQLGIEEGDVLTDYLETIREKLHYQKWFFGHYHQDREVTNKDILLYHQIRPLY